jgi:apolipoprotein N-acyltransferase
MVINPLIKSWTVYIFPIISAVSLASSYSDCKTSNLAWVALVPLLLVLHEKSLFKSLFISGIFGIVYLHGMFYWILNIPSYTIMHHLILLLVFSSLYLAFGLILALIAVHTSYSLALLAAPFAWVTIEYIRSNLFFLALPMGLVGHTQYLNQPLIQLSSICGAYGVSFIVVAVNGAITEQILNYRAGNINNVFKKKIKISRNLVSLTTLALIVPAMLFGHWTRSQPIKGNPIKIALIQGNIDQAKKWDPNFSDMILQTYTELTKKASLDQPSLIVWPETATPGSIENNPGLVPRLKKLARKTNSYLVVGSAQGMKFMEEKESKYKYKNSAILLSPNNKTSDIHQYNKIKLFPFGEYLPLRGRLPWHIIDVDSANEYIPGKEYKIFKLPSSKFAVTICWENIFPALCRKFVKQGAQFIVNITNEARFGKSPAPYQLMVINIFRAVENRIYIARCANTGISCIIDPFGKIIARVKDSMKNDIFVQGILNGTIIPVESKTLYTKYGDVFAWICIILTCLFVFLSITKSIETL